MARTIGTITTYDGDEHPYLRGHRIRIVVVIKGAAHAPNVTHPTEVNTALRNFLKRYA